MISLNLLKKTKKVFEKKYGRKVSDAEAEEIANNLLSYMEVFTQKNYHLT